VRLASLLLRGFSFLEKTIKTILHQVDYQPINTFEVKKLGSLADNQLNTI
jgi:hypothetical protein